MLYCRLAVLGHGSAVVGSAPPRGSNNMFASAGDSPGIPLQGLPGNTQRRPGTATNNIFNNAGAGNRLGGGGNGMRMGLPRGGLGIGTSCMAAPATLSCLLC